MSIHQMQTPINLPAYFWFSPGKLVHHCCEVGAPADESDCSCECKEQEERGTAQRSVHEVLHRAVPMSTTGDETLRHLIF